MATCAPGPHVLVVDDDGDVRDALGALLSGEGFEVELAGDGLEALECCAACGRLDAIVCDLAMPRLDGVGFLKRLRRRGYHCVVVVLSGHFDLLADALGLGQVYALAKPVDPDRLVRTIREAVEMRA